MREKLIELLEQINGCCPRESDCYHCEYECLDDCSVYAKADYLIANGVTVQPCNVGDTVYVIYSTAEYKTRSGSRRRENHQIVTKHHLEWAKKENAVEIREKKCTKSDLNLLGKTVFTTKEDAEKAVEV